MRSLLVLLVAAVAACGPSNRDTGDATPAPDACVGLECRVTNCGMRPPTTISGTVFAPNGTLALYGATVYVPNGDPGPLQDGAVCGQCQNNLPGGAVAHAISDEFGKFTLTNVPSGRNIPVIIQIGKWRRQLQVANVTECQDNPVPATDTSLPKNHLEGDMPRIAMVTGGCDALECLVRKLGVADSEFTNDSGSGRIHLFDGGGASAGPGGQTLAAADTLWSSVDTLKKYDVTMMSCNCSEEARTPASLTALKAYADLGGRVFMSHYHNNWISADWPGVATCDVDDLASGTDTIDQVNNPKGTSFANWMVNVQGSTTLGIVPITEGKKSCTTIDNTRAERWVYNTNDMTPQNFQLTTPNDVAENARCGRVVFSDMHVASGSSSGTQFPNSCATTPLSPQEKALAFMFFDISTCVGPIF